MNTNENNNGDADVQLALDVPPATISGPNSSPAYSRGGAGDDPTGAIAAGGLTNSDMPGLRSDTGGDVGNGPLGSGEGAADVLDRNDGVNASPLFNGENRGAGIGNPVGETGDLGLSEGADS